MSEEEKKAYFSIEELASQLEYGNIDFKYYVEMKEFKMEEEYSKELFSLLNLIEKQQKEIEHWKEQAEGYAQQIKEEYEQRLL